MWDCVCVYVCTRGQCACGVPANRWCLIYESPPLHSTLHGPAGTKHPKWWSHLSTVSTLVFYKEHMKHALKQVIVSEENFRTRIHHALPSRCLFSPKFILQQDNDPKHAVIKNYFSDKQDKESCSRWCSPLGALISTSLSQPGITRRDRRHWICKCLEQTTS